MPPDAHCAYKSEAMPPRRSPESPSTTRWAPKLAVAAVKAIPRSSWGVAYDTGQGVAQDSAEAARWFRLAADQGHAEAQFNLGVMYDEGKGVPQDDAEAARWYQLAADQGLTEAQYNLGVTYDEGEGVPQDDAEAARWYRLAAEQGHGSAQFNLGLMYGSGKRVPQDDIEAHMWLNLATAQASAEERDEYVKERDDVAARMTPEQIAEAQRRAREWTPTDQP